MVHICWRLAHRLIVASFLLCTFTTSSVHPQQAGVLLGYVGPSATSHETMWIVFSPNDARAIATVPDIIVPRASGFWRVNISTVCEFNSELQQDSSHDVIWQTPIENSPLISKSDCKAHSPNDLENSDSAVPLCSRETAKLAFVSPDYIAEEFNAYDQCDPRGGHDQTRNDVRHLDSSTPISLADLFSERALPAYGAAAEKGFAKNSRDYNCPEPNPDAFDLKSWKISHIRGAWRPVAAINEFMGECAFPYETDLPLSKGITGEVSKASLWPTVAKAIPHLSDFYLSPLGDYALILVAPKETEFHLYGYAAKDGLPTNRLAEIPWDNVNVRPVVMAQWSSGKYVTKWTEVILKIKEHPLPQQSAEMPNSSANSR